MGSESALGSMLGVEPTLKNTYAHTHMYMYTHGLHTRHAHVLGMMCTYMSCVHTRTCI